MEYILFLASTVLTINAAHFKGTEFKADEVKITLYYESLCPGCIYFVDEQLYPTYKNIGKPLKVDLVPFGHCNATNDTGKWEFNCQHGANECKGNKYHSCAISLFSVEASIEFVYCTLKSGFPSSAVILQLCSWKAGISWNSLHNCYESGQGDKLLALNGIRTNALKPKLKYTPTIVFNDVYNETLDNQAIDGLQKVVCSLLNGKPDVCKKTFFLQDVDDASLQQI